MNECRAMESFIVRIYQRNSGENVVGTVELVGKNCQKTFRNMKELVSILSSPRVWRTARKAAVVASFDDKGKTS